MPYGYVVAVLTLMAQLGRDFLIYGECDGEEIFNTLGATQKEMRWIDDATVRYQSNRMLTVDPLQPFS